MWKTTSFTVCKVVLVGVTLSIRLFEGAALWDSKGFRQCFAFVGYFQHRIVQVVLYWPRRFVYMYERFHQSSSDWLRGQRFRYSLNVRQSTFAVRPRSVEWNRCAPSKCVYSSDNKASRILATGFKDMFKKKMHVGIPSNHALFLSR